MKHFLSFIAVLGLLLTACSSEEPAMPDGAMTRSTEQADMPHARKADFDKYVSGKIWTSLATESDPISPTTFVNAYGAYDLLPWSGTWHSRRGFRISGDRYQQFDQMGPGWDDRNGPRMQINSCSFVYDETTGMLTCSDCINYFSAHPQSLYVESVSEDRMVIREEYGCLPVGYRGDINEECSGEIDPESYFRTEYHAVPQQEEAKWYGSYTDIRLWRQIVNSPEYQLQPTQSILERIRAIQLQDIELLETAI